MDATPTPRTDRECEHFLQNAITGEIVNHPKLFVPVEFARQLERELNLLKQRTTELRELKSTVRTFVAEFDDIKWGYDGDCGSQRLVSALEYEVTKDDNGH